MVHGNRCNPFHCKKIRKNSTYTNRQKRQPRYMGYHLQHIDINSLKIMYLATVKLGEDVDAICTWDTPGQEETRLRTIPLDPLSSIACASGARPPVADACV